MGRTTLSTIIDTPTVEELETIWASCQAVRDQREEDRRTPTLGRLWDGNWDYMGGITEHISEDFEWKNNDTGGATVDLPLTSWVSKKCLDVWGRPTKNVHVTFDKDGARWGGRLQKGEIIKDSSGQRLLRLTFLHDYEELKHIRVWPSPLSPAAVQFPRSWTMICNAKWGLLTTLEINLWRLEGSLWALPNDPLDPAQWADTIDRSRWAIRTMPNPLWGDTSPICLIASRMKTWHDMAAPILQSAHLTVECNRWLEGDPLPYPGAKVRNGTLFVDIKDKSGWWNPDGTATHGNLFTGFIRTIQNITGTDVDTTQTVVPAPGTDPDEYKNIPYWLGTVPGRPYVVYRDGPLTGITSSNYSFSPPTDVQFIVGGHSAYGVNEATEATIKLIGNYLGMLFVLPTLGDIAATFVMPLIEDTILAWWVVKSSLRDSERRNPGIFQNQALGWSKYWEYMCDGADRGYTISAFFALRQGYWATRERISHQVEIQDGAPWYIGANGKGHFFLGDIIGCTVIGLPEDVMVTEQVTTLKYTETRTARGWSATVGDISQQQSPIETILSRVKEVAAQVQDLGFI